MALLEQWQSKLDSDFPKGIVWVWNRPGTPIVYNLPWLEVLGMRGLDPIVIGAAAASLKVLGPWQVTSYSISTRDPLQARVTFGNITDAASWLQPTTLMGGRMAGERAKEMVARPWSSMLDVA